MGKQWTQCQTLFWGAPKSMQMVIAAMKLKDAYSLEETQAGIKIAGRSINNLRYADDTTLMAESEEKLKSLLMKVKVESEKSWLKAQHSENEDHGTQSHHFMGNRWGNSGNSVRLYYFGLKNHCRW